MNGGVFPGVVRLLRRAMGCEFELALLGDDRDYLVDAGEEALDIAQRLEDQLSVFRADSEVSYINANAALGPVRVETGLFGLLELTEQISRETAGAFDITAGPLVRLWGFAGGSRPDRMPSEADIENALNSTGMRYVHLDCGEQTIRFLRPGMEINLGAIGKGYAVQEIAGFLLERGVVDGLISAGTSTVCAIGSPPDTDGWQVGLRGGREPGGHIAVVSLSNEAMSTSGSYEQSLDVEGRSLTHIIDPRSGYPVEGMLSTSVIADSAAESDALSTAFFVMGIDDARSYCRTHAGVHAILASSGHGGVPDVVEIREES